MLDKIKKVTDEFINCQDLKTWLKLFSILTWNKIGFARTRDKLKIYETTITQDLLFNFRLFAEGTSLPLEMFESNLEKTNGNDIEIFIEVNSNEYVMFPCQAKIIYKNEKYVAINHIVSSNQQIEMLINYARVKRGVPIYLLYNFINSQEVINEIRKKNKIDIEEFGCSIIVANYLKDNFFYDNQGVLKIRKLPEFRDLHPDFAIPFYKILEFLNNINELNNFINKKNITYKLYTREELIDEKNWVDLVPTPSIGKISIEEKVIPDINQLKNEPIENFSPKFRFIFSNNTITKTHQIVILG